LGARQMPTRNRKSANWGCVYVDSEEMPRVRTGTVPDIRGATASDSNHVAAVASII